MIQDGEAAMQKFNEAVEIMSHKPDSQQAEAIVREIGEWVAPLATAMDAAANPGGGGDPFVAEWLKTGFGAIGPLRRMRRRSDAPASLPRGMAEAEQQGYRIVVGERGGLDTTARQTAAALGGKDRLNDRIIHHNQDRTNLTAARAVGDILPERGRPTLDRTKLTVALGQARAPITDMVTTLDDFLKNTPGAKPRAWMSSLRQVDRAAERIMNNEGSVATLSQLRTMVERVRRTAPAEHADALNPQLNQVLQRATVRTFADEPGNLDAVALSKWARPQDAAWMGDDLGTISTYASRFPQSAKLATNVSTPTSGISIFDIMLAPAVLGTIGLEMAGAGGGVVTGAALLAAGIGALTGLRKLGQSYGFRPITPRSLPDLGPTRQGINIGAGASRSPTIQGIEQAIEEPTDAQN
jgi:hypothetical protein